MSIIRRYEDELEKIATLNIKELIDDSHHYRDKFFKSNKFFHKTKLHYYWSVLMLIVIFTGLYVLLDSF